METKKSSKSKRGKAAPSGESIPSNNNAKINTARNVFISSVCHFCKDVADPVRGTKLSTCSGCRLVNYCCRDHQKKDWKLHKSLCNVTQDVLQSEKKTYLFQDCAQIFPSQAEWLQIRYGYMQLIRERLGRELDPYEKEIFLFPQYFCSVCSQTRISLCDRCHHHHHESSLSSKTGTEWCDEFNLWLETVRWESSNGLVKPASHEDEMSVPINNIHQDFPRDMETYANSTKGSTKTNHIPKPVWKIALADVTTVPLTIVWSILKYKPELSKSETLTLHLVGAESEFEGCCAPKWEFCFLHFFQHLKSLKIILIGPELDTMGQTKKTQKLCESCTAKGRELSIINKPGVLYHEFRKQKGCAVPDVICAFNCGLYRRTGYAGGDTWSPTIPQFASTCIFVTTAYTETEVAQDINRIKSECQGLEICGNYERNPYRSLRPQRTLINEHIEPLMYKNQYVAIFQSRENSNSLP